jgi:hypothetical protein
MSLPKGTVTFHSGPGGGTPTAEIHGVQNLHVETQEELDALHRLVAEGRPLPLKPAPGQKPRR